MSALQNDLPSAMILEGKFMKKAKSEANDWLRSEYKRSDLGTIVRGKYARRMALKSNRELAKASTRPTTRSIRTRQTVAHQ